MPKIPYLSIPDKPIVATTQDQSPIADVTNDVVIYKDGGAALVMESTSLNFGLLSEKEQSAVIAAYAAMINSLSFSIQIVVTSQRKDIKNYLAFLGEAKKNIRTPLMQKLMQSYEGFITDSVKKKVILGKRFFVVIPLSPLELGVGKSLKTFTQVKKGPLPYSKNYVIKKAKVLLYPRRDHLIRQAGRVGVKLRQLNTNELVRLLYKTYNPEKPAVKQEPTVTEQ